MIICMSVHGSFKEFPLVNLGFPLLISKLLQPAIDSPIQLKGLIFKGDL